MKNTYAITFPAHSTNVGDNLIFESVENLIKNIKGSVELIKFPNKKKLNDEISKINSCDALILPNFAIQENMYPDQFFLVDDLDSIKVPIIPMSAGWKGKLGDYETLRKLKYSQKTLKFLQYVSNQIKKIPCRDFYTVEALRKHGITNTVMAGDPAWYDFEKMGTEMKRPNEIKTLIYTTPHAAWCNPQAKKIAKMISEIFPNATKYCCMHSGLGLEDDEIAQYAKSIGFTIKDVSKNLENISFYKNTDLHIGYRLHAHIYFLRNRIPSILVNEDGRGVGFSYTLGIGGFNSFSRDTKSVRQKIRTAKNRGIVEIPVANPYLQDQIRSFLLEEVDSGFRRYLGIPKILDDTFENVMKPWIKSFPNP